MSNQDIQKAVHAAIEKSAHKEAIRRVRLFGSRLHGDARPDSDVDLLVDFEDDASIGYFTLVNIQDTFEKELGHKVDLVTAPALSKFFRTEVLKEALSLYEKRYNSH